MTEKWLLHPWKVRKEQEHDEGTEDEALEDQQQIVFDEGTEDEALDNQRDAELNWKRGEEVSRTYGWR